MQMAEGQIRVSRGCFYCRNGKENEVIQRFGMSFPDAKAISPIRIKYRRTKEGATEEKVRLLPGYVFFQMTEYGPQLVDGVDELLVALNLFTRTENVIRLLRYSDGGWRLFGADDLFAEMLFKADGTIGLSQAYFDKGDRIRILEGFLKNYEGNITSVNRKHKLVDVVVDLQGKRVTMRLGYELVEPVQDTAQPPGNPDAS